MNIKHENFIGIYEKAFSKEYCENVIKYFDNMEAAGVCLNRMVQDSTLPIYKDDSLMFLSESNTIPLEQSKELYMHFNSIFWDVCYSDYANKYSVIKTSDFHSSYCYKIQKTNLTQGYHIWHYESCTRATSNRLLVWTLYLNDVEDGGETEFLYQSMRVKPKQGTLLIWPATFTHTHRGNPPLSNVKYIITGWVEF